MASFKGLGIRDILNVFVIPAFLGALAAFLAMDVLPSVITYTAEGTKAAIAINRAVDEDVRKIVSAFNGQGSILKAIGIPLLGGFVGLFLSMASRESAP